MKLFKRIILTILLFYCSFFCFCMNAKYKGKNYSISSIYSDQLIPGDPIFIKLEFVFNTYSSKKINGLISLCEASSLEVINKNELYTISSKNKKCVTLFSGIPTSTYLNDKEYCLKIEYIINDQISNSFSLPLKFTNKEFLTEVLKLDQKNSAIKNDFSKERMDQISKLNSILDTKNYSNYTNSVLTSFTEPLICNRRTSFFGDRRIYLYIDDKSTTNLHYGIDYGVQTGTDVFPCSSGKVVLAENRISTGYSVCIEHLPGLYSLYYHLDSLNVSLNDIVTPKTLIGKSGCTGLATGPHLHWEMRLNMEACNPDYFVTTFTDLFVK